MKNENLNSKQEFNPKDFLNALQKLKNIPDYQNLGFTLKSLCKITQTALLAEIENPPMDRTLPLGSLQYPPTDPFPYP